MEHSYCNAFPISPSDSTSVIFDALYVGGTGNVTLTLIGGTQVTFTGVQVGTTLKVRGLAVRATGTTATNLLGLCL